MVKYPKGTTDAMVESDKAKQGHNSNIQGAVSIVVKKVIGEKHTAKCNEYI